MLGIEKVVVGVLATNCYLVYSGKSRETIIIDPGDDADAIVNRIRDLELKPVKIIATHGHFDHVLAVNELKLIYKIPFLLSEKDEVMLKWFRKSAKYFTGFDPGPAPTVDKYLGQELSISNFQFSIIETSGHTPGGVCLYSKRKSVLFSGDTIFAEGAVGRTDYPYCNHDNLIKSVDKLLKLPPETVVYPGHGSETTIGEERQFHLLQK